MGNKVVKARHLAPLLHPEQTQFQQQLQQVGTKVLFNVSTGCPGSRTCLPYIMRLEETFGKALSRLNVRLK